MIKKIADILYKYKVFFLLSIILITIFFGKKINIKIDNSLGVWFLEDDPEYKIYKEFKNSFEEDKFLIIALKSENIFSLEVLNYIKKKTAQLEGIPKVNRVFTLATANKIVALEDGIKIDSLISKLEKSNIEKIKDYALKDEIFKDYLVSKDGKYTALIVTFKELDYEETKESISKIKEILLRDKPRNLEIFLSGDIKGSFEFDRFSMENQRLFPVLIILIISLFLYLIFKSFYRVIIILLVVFISLCWALGFYCSLGFSFSVVTGMLIPVVLILSIADCLHIIKYWEEIDEGENIETTFIKTLQFITIPCFITSITTSFGLLALSLSRIQSVRNFGIGSASGIMFAFLVSIIVTPILLTWTSSKQKRKIPIMDSILEYIHKFDIKYFKLILIFSFLAVVLLGYGIKKIKVETNEIEYFSKKSDFYISSMLINRNLCGVMNMELFLKGEKDLFKEPFILKRLDSLCEEIKKLPFVKKVISISDYLKRINRALFEDKKNFYRIPDKRDLIAQELFLFTLSQKGREELERVVNSDYSKSRVSIKISSIPSEDMVSLAKLIKEKAKKIFSKNMGIEVFLTGASYLYSLNNKRILEDMVRGFSLAFILVGGVLFLLFRSFRYGILSLIPNLLPIIFIIGIMGYFNITLNVATVMIASVALGISVDDTIHLLIRFRKENEDSPIIEALRISIINAGRPIIFTSLINIAGFLILLTSKFRPTLEFGVLVSLTLFFALVLDLFLLPALIRLIER